jgi:hypothetical protein
MPDFAPQNYFLAGKQPPNQVRQGGHTYGGNREAEKNGRSFDIFSAFGLCAFGNGFIAHFPPR